MNKVNGFSVLAVLGGGMLALMIQINSQLASQTSALQASWIAHAVGMIGAWCLLSLISTKSTQHKRPTNPPSRIYYFGGIPGAFTVILASITVNSVIGLSGTLALGLIGQLLFSLISEHWGLFQLPKKSLKWIDITPSLLVVTGSILLIYGRG